MWNQWRMFRLTATKTVSRDAVIYWISSASVITLGDLTCKEAIWSGYQSGARNSKFWKKFDNHIPVRWDNESVERLPRWTSTEGCKSYTAAQTTWKELCIRFNPLVDGCGTRMALGLSSKSIRVFNKYIIKRRNVLSEFCLRIYWLHIMLWILIKGYEIKF